MKVRKYQIGRYHAIIKKEYADNSVDYETSFNDSNDLMQSIYALNRCIGNLIGIATPNPQVLIKCSVIRGREDIIKELSSKGVKNE